MRCPKGFIPNSDNLLCDCPAALPFLDENNICVACATKWDESALKCIVCDETKIWNSKSKQC